LETENESRNPFYLRSTSQTDFDLDYMVPMIQVAIPSISGQRLRLSDYKAERIL